ncbi:hypothetical protein VTL71DRAFT_9727 [Oculimacula yallundae]|uniref:BTB domain-containing protein n=1 Tax=Oculimacula yallundae TaxID=86028 RepID=A0ABR4BSI4_9HELO
MSSGTPDHQFRMNPSNDMVLIQSGPPHNVQSFNAHRNLIVILNMPMFPASAIIPGGILVFKKSNPEVLKQFEAWLYSTERNKQFAEGVDLSLLLDIYKFAQYYEIIDLGLACVCAYESYELLFFVLEQKFDRTDNAGKELISDFIADLMKELGGLIDGADEQSPRIVHHFVGFYRFGLKLQNPSLCNVMMDALQQHMCGMFLFTLAEVENIFSRTDSWALIRVFCAALIHYQRHSSDKSEHINRQEMKRYRQIPGFSQQYEEYKTAFRGFNTTFETSWDPRFLGGFDKCYFHHHTMELNDDHIADYEGEEDVEESELEESESEESESEEAESEGSESEGSELESSELESSGSEDSGSEDQEVGSRSINASSLVIPLRPAEVARPPPPQDWHAALATRSSSKRKAEDEDEDDEDSRISLFTILHLEEKQVLMMVGGGTCWTTDR